MDVSNRIYSLGFKTAFNHSFYLLLNLQHLKLLGMSVINLCILLHLRSFLYS